MKTTTQNDWPCSAPQEEPGPQGSDGRLWQLVWPLRQSSRRIMSIAWCEILLQVNSIIPWLVLLAATLLTVWYVPSQVSSISGYVSDGQAAVAICAYGASFSFFLLPFLYVNTFTRDYRRKMDQLVWTRPLASLEYALGKGLGAVGLSLLISWLPLLAGWLAASVVRGGMQPVLLWLQMLLIVGAVAVLITCFALLGIALYEPLGLLGALIPAAIVAYVDVFLPKSMLFLTNILAATLFVSPSIGFGPDGSLLLWQRISYAMGGLCCLGLLALVYQVRERLGVVQMRHIVSTALLLLLAGSALFASLLTYQSVGAAYTDSGSLLAKPVQATTSHYQINVTANPASGEVQGDVSFTLTPQKTLGSSFVIGLNPGIHVQHVEGMENHTGNPHTLSFAETSAGWTRINVQGTRLEAGQALDFKISYAGQMLLGRNDYARAAAGFGRDYGVSWDQSYYYLSYVGQGSVELVGAAGSWYPLPLTQQALDAGTRIPVDEIHLRFPAAYKVWSGLTAVMHQSDSNWQMLSAYPHSGLPVALAVALSNAQQGSVGGLPFWYQGEAPSQQQLFRYHTTMQEFQALNRWLAPQATQAFQTVVVPILPLPAIGNGLLLIPETLVLNMGVLNTGTVIARVSARDVSQVWWLNAAFFPFAVLHGDADTQNATPSSVSYPVNALLQMLSEYSAAVITDQAIGSNFFLNEMQTCSQVYALTTTKSFNKADAQQEQNLSQEMALLGTTCLPMELVPYRLSLAKNVGFTRLTSFLQQYALAHAQQKTDIRQFLQQGSVLAGKDITSEAAPYVCPSGAKTAPASGATDPLACLSENYSGT